MCAVVARCLITLSVTDSRVAGPPKDGSGPSVGVSPAIAKSKIDRPAPSPVGVVTDTPSTARNDPSVRSTSVSRTSALSWTSGGSGRGRTLTMKPDPPPPKPSVSRLAVGPPNVGSIAPLEVSRSASTTPELPTLKTTALSPGAGRICVCRTCVCGSGNGRVDVGKPEIGTTPPEPKDGSGRPAAV